MWNSQFDYEYVLKLKSIMEAYLSMEGKSDEELLFSDDIRQMDRVFFVEGFDDSKKVRNYANDYASLYPFIPLNPITFELL